MYGWPVPVAPASSSVTMLGVLQRRENLTLRQEPPRHVGALERRADNLDRDGVLEQSVGSLRAIDIPHAAFADLLQQPVVTDASTKSEWSRATCRTAWILEQGRNDSARSCAARSSFTSSLDFGASCRAPTRGRLVPWRHLRVPSAKISSTIA